jgi:hypothetical protein
METDIVQSQKDKLVCEIAWEYLLHKHVHHFSKQEVNSFVQPPGKQKPTTLNDVYKRLIESAQNRGMGPQVIGQSIRGIDNLRGILFDFDPSKVVQKYDYDSSEVLFNDIRAKLEPTGQLRTAKGSLWPLFCRSIVSGAAFLSRFPTAKEFHSWVDRFYGDERARPALPMLLDKEIVGFGFALACDFLKEIGYHDYAKPDVHLKAIFVKLGLSTSNDDYQVFKDIIRVARNTNKTPYYVDKLFWLTSGREYGGNRKHFLAFAQAELSSRILSTHD